MESTSLPTSREPSPESSCAYCDLVDDPDVSTEERHRLFHQECETCPPDDPAGHQEPLCAFCEHLRLRHVLFCPDDIPRSEVTLGSWEDVRSRAASGCALCELISAACKLALERREFKDHSPSSLEFNLGFLEAVADNEDSASLNICVYDTSGGHITDALVCQAYVRQDEDADPSAWPLRDNNKDLVQSSIDWGRVKGWLRRCCAEHDRCSHACLATPPPGFRVIDVETMQLVRPEAECQFITLSYVWGVEPDPSKLQTTMSNVERLEQAGALKSSEVPAAIDQAMQVCRELGERYLWADRLCIVQDDPVNKQQQIMSMVDIYSSAVLALALCAGASMDDSIPGVETPRPAIKKTVEINDLLVTTVLPDFGPAVMSSAWASRGWTYQEAVLPARKLYFTPLQLLYECRIGHVYEDNFLNDCPWSETDVPCGGGYENRMPALHGTYTDSSRFPAYSSHVQNYNKRRLTYTSDIYNAFGGALSALYGDTSAIMHGLPLPNFDEALLWYPDVESDDEPPEHRTSPDVRLPTWSWSSVSGGVFHLDGSLGFHGSIVRWERICATGHETTSTPIWESDEPSREEWMTHPEPDVEKTRRLQSPQLYMALAAAAGCVENALNLEPDFYRTTSFGDMASSLITRWPQYQDFRHEVLGKGQPSRITIPDTTVIDGPAIATRAQLASLSLGEHVHERAMGPCSREGVWLEIRDPTGGCIGMLAPSPSLSGWSPPPTTPSFDFIGISVSSLSASNLGYGLGCHYASAGYNFEQTPSNRDETLREVRHLDFTYWDSEDKPLSSAPVINVMQIERKAGLARRISIGWVLLTKWARLAKRYETIVLS